MFLSDYVVPVIILKLRHYRLLYKMKRELENNEAGIQDINDELYERFSFISDKGQEPLRIDKFLMGRIERATRNKIQQAINAGMVLVNSKEVRPNYKVKAGDEIIVYSDMSPEEI